MEKIVAPIFRATATAFNEALVPEGSLLLEAAANAAAAGADAGFSSTTAAVVRSAAFAAVAAKANNAASFAAASTASAARAASMINESDDIWASTNQDIEFIGENWGAWNQLLFKPLWPNGPPKWVAHFWFELRQILPANDNWWVWADWYSRRLNGSYNNAYDPPYAIVPIALWDEGPAAANAWIADRLRELDEKKRAQADLPLVDEVTIERALSQDPHGAPIEVVEGKARIAPSENADDLAVAEDIQTVQLHERVRSRASATRHRVQRLANQLGFESIAATVDEFAHLLAQDTPTVARNISTIWEITTAIGTFIERDDEVKAGRGGLTPRMDADARETLDQLLIAAASFVRRFPTARQNDEEVRLFRQARESVETPKRILEQAAYENLIDAETKAFIAIGLNAADRSKGIQAEKSRSWLSRTARNLVVAFIFASGVAFTPVGKYGEKAIEDFYEHSQFRDPIQKFLREKESEVIELFSDLPADLRTALREVYRRLKDGGSHPRPPSDPTQRA